MKQVIAFNCGYRTVGFYVCERLVAGGSPLETFIPCPPPYVDMDAIKLAKTGMRIIERVDAYGNGLGIYDLWDYVSRKEQPYPPHFLEQTRNFGTSRKFPRTMMQDPNLQKLRAHPFDPSLSSRHIYVHERALIEDPGNEVFYANRTAIKKCPAGIGDHDANISTWETCAALWWEMDGPIPADESERRHKVLLPLNWKKYGSPSCSYHADYMPKGVNPKDLRFLTGIIMSIPLMQMEIPRDDSGDNEHDRLAKLLEDGGWQYNYEITEG